MVAHLLMPPWTVCLVVVAVDHFLLQAVQEAQLTMVCQCFLKAGEGAVPPSAVHRLSVVEGAVWILPGHLHPVSLKEAVAAVIQAH